MYDELADWYHLLTAPDEYAEEAADYERFLTDACPEAQTLLELGSGGGNVASHLKRRFRCTLSDVSPPMLGVSARINPECAHIWGDMRTMRLERQFDVVLVHDAIAYMVSEADLRAAIATAYAHTRPGGIALFTPDFTRETFVAGAEQGGCDDDGRGARYLAWVHEPDPGASTYLVDYAFLLRERDGTVRTAHEQHVEGLFSRATWHALLAAVGFAVEEPEMNPLVHAQQVAFLCRRPV
jgi:SAM-dependent methyltransferase